MSSLRQLRLARAYYFFYFGALGCYLPFINLYFKDVGLSGRAIGLLAALPPLLIVVAGPLWGVLADRFRIHRWLLPLGTLGPIVPSLLILHAEQFLSLALLVVWASFFLTPVLALIDSAVLDMVPGSGQTYGNVRVWGSIGFTVFTWVMGYALTHLGLTWLFYGYASLLAIAAALSIGLPARRQAWQINYRSGFRQLVRQRSLALFLLSAFLVGATLQASYSFYPLYLQALGGSPAWVGLAGALAAITETPFIFYSGQIFKWLGVRGSLLLSYVMFGVRWALLATLRAPVLVLGTNLLHGVTFAPFLVGSIAYVEQRTPAGLHATAQGLLVAAVFGLGAAAGALGGGWLYDALGPAGLFGVAALTTLLAAVFLLSAGQMAAARPELGRPER